MKYLLLLLLVSCGKSELTKCQEELAMTPNNITIKEKCDEIRLEEQRSIDAANDAAMTIMILQVNGII